VVAASTTTLLASMVLSLCTITFFGEFGFFLVVSMVVSLFVAVVFFHALLALFGPAPHAYM
jgi:hypothetical protein